MITLETAASLREQIARLRQSGKRIKPWGWEGDVDRLIEATGELRAPVSNVWALVSEPYHLPNWWPVYQGVEPDRRGLARAGPERTEATVFVAGPWWRLLAEGARAPAASARARARPLSDFSFA